MSRYIDRDVLRKAITEYVATPLTPMTPQDIVKVVWNVPTADVVEVVRCKDCRLWTPSKRYGTDHNDIKRYYGNCAVTNRSEREDHYCSYGGRSEE